MKSVCIIGAGPAGLVAAKTLLQTGKFSVTVFEKGDRIGGIWALDEQTKNGWLNPNTPTNLSRFTVSFSDLAWSSVLDPPMFPKAWQVNRYLETYRKKYIPEDVIKLNTPVKKAVRSEGWTVTTDKEQKFDYLIMATGFFAAPRPLGMPSTIKTIHSSEFKSLKDLFPDEVTGDILVIGGGNSAGEAAGVVAGQLSNARWTGDMRYNCKVVHVTPRPVYAMPPFLPSENGYVPLDFHFYNLEKRVGPIQAGAGITTKEFRDLLHSGVQASVGDQSDLASALMPDDGAVQVALTESYAEYVRSGLIEVVGGRVQSIGRETVLDTGVVMNVGAVIYATGYTPLPLILDDATKEALHYEESLRLPLILDQWQTNGLPDLALHGFYEGPYWGVMEMQAKVTAARWLGKTIEQRPYETKEKLLELRNAMKEKRLDVPQYWLGDYLGYMEEMAHELDLPRNDGKFKERQGLALPARYALGEEADKTMLDAWEVWNACKKGKYFARAAFRALQGKWDVNRTVGEGRFVGKAEFHPRASTYDLEYLYVEEGTLYLHGEMPATRRYAYRYDEAADEMSVWFVNGLEVDYLFHKLSFDGQVATAEHLCIKDMYRTKYTLPLEGVSLKRFEIEHDVKGPEKDYVMKTKYTRPARIVE